MFLAADSIIASAFLFGIVSAVSLPLGTITSLFWKPSDRAIAFLMAFGAGALLAALTLDLVAGTVAKGHFYSLAAGCIVGGLVFIALNNVINNFGGFLRKASTTVYHLRKQQYQQFKKILTALKRVDVFQNLSDESYKVLARAIHIKTFKKGELIFNKGDFPDELFIIASGKVTLLDPTERIPSKQLLIHDDLGWLAFLTGVPYRFTARATEDVSLWVLPKITFFSLFSTSVHFSEAVQDWLRNSAVTEYLTVKHGLPADVVEHWQDRAVHGLLRRGSYSPVLTVSNNSQLFRSVVNQFIGCDLFKSLSEEDIEAISDRLIYKRFSSGETLYFQGEDSTNMFVIDYGHVSMLDGVERRNHVYDLTKHHYLGYMSFLTGGNYSMTTVAIEETGTWVLHKKDFNELLIALPELAKRYKNYIQRHEVNEYLTERQYLSHNNVLKWVRKSIRQLDNKKTLRPVNTLGFDISEHKGAPLGIWLGLFLDSIPEALVIGAHVAQAGLGFSLLAGLFFSNYPEALSSSVGMREQGMKFRNVLLMWTVLMLSTGVVSALGSVYFSGVNDSTFAFTEGLAAGAMLTMIAQTMLPEAYLKGGEIVGFSSLLGFLFAIFFKTLE